MEKIFPHQPFKYSYKLDRFTLSQKYLCIFKTVYLFWFHDCWNFVRRCHVTISVEEEDSHAKTGRPALSIIRNRLNKTFPTCFLHGHLALTHFKRCQKWPPNKHLVTLYSRLSLNPWDYCYMDKYFPYIFVFGYDEMYNIAQDKTYTLFS